MKRKTFFVLLIILFVSLIGLWRYYGNERVIGYQIHVMVRAADRSKYNDTVGTVYKKGSQIIYKERPGLYAHY